MRSRVRRTITIAALAALTLGGVSSAAATGTAHRLPDRVSAAVPQIYPAARYAAGDPCPFPLQVRFGVNHVVARTVTDAKGGVVAIHYTGALFAVITRTDTGRHVRVNLSGDGVQVFDADGSSTLYGNGPFASTQHGGDHPGPELAILHGASAVHYSATGTKTILYSSAVTDLCTTLS